MGGALPVGLGDEGAQRFRRKLAARSAVVFGDMERTCAFRQRGERTHVVVAEDERRTAFREFPGRFADVGLVLRIERTIARDGPFPVYRPLPRFRVLLGQVGGPVPDDRLEQDRRLDRAAFEQLRPPAVAGHAGVHGFHRGPALRMERKAVQAVRVAGAFGELLRVRRGDFLPARTRRDDVEHRERILGYHLPKSVLGRRDCGNKRNCGREKHFTRCHGLNHLQFIVSRAFQRRPERPLSRIRPA